MNAVLEIGLSNALIASVLALVAWGVTRVWRRPQVALVLWLAVLAKLVTPGLLVLPLASLRSPEVEQVEPATIDEAPVDIPLAALEAELAKLIAAMPETGPPSVERFVDTVVDEPPAAEAGHGMPDADTVDSDWSKSDPAMPPPEDPFDRAIVDSPDELADALLPPELPAEVPAKTSVSFNWPSALAGFWLAGSAAWLALAVARVVRFRRVLQLAEPAGDELTGEVARLAARIGLARSPAVRLTLRRVPPLVWGLVGRPTMLLPIELVQSLSDEARETLLVHELAHLTRRASSARWLELAAIGLYWWHPVAWWARRNVEEAEEQCCDARVVAMLPHAARAYAETLLATVEFLAEPGGVAPWGARAFAEIGPIQRRLTMILDERASERMTWPARAMLAIVALAVLPVSISSLWADPAKTPEAAAEVAKADEPKPTAGVADAQPAADVAEVIVVEAAPAAAEKTAEQPDQSSVEARLERLERLLEMRTPLKVESAPAQESKPAAEAVPASEAKSPSLAKELKERPKQYTPAVLDTRSLGELEREIDDVVDRTRRQAEMQVRILEANSNRLAATQRQVEALTKAYDTGTITADQVLEAIRRRAEARNNHARTASDLTNSSGMSEYLRELGGLIAAEQARRDTKAFWIALVDRGAPKNEIAQASVQHELFNAQVRLSSDAVKRLQRYRVDRMNSMDQRSAEDRAQATILYNQARDAVQASATQKLTAGDRVLQRQREERLLAAKNTLLATEEAVTQRLADIKAMDAQAKRLRAAASGDKDAAKQVELETMQNAQQMLEHKYVEAIRARVLAMHQLEHLLDEPSRLARAQTAAAPIPEKIAEDRDRRAKALREEQDANLTNVTDRLNASVQQLFKEGKALDDQSTAILQRIHESEKRETSEGEASREANRAITAGYKAKLEVLNAKSAKLHETIREIRRVWSLTDATVKELNPQATPTAAEQPDAPPVEKPATQPAPAPADDKQSQSRRDTATNDRQQVATQATRAGRTITRNANGEQFAKWGIENVPVIVRLATSFHDLRKLRAPIEEQIELTLAEIREQETRLATIREASRQATQRKIDENNQAVDRLRADLVMLQETSDELLRIARMTQSTLQELHLSREIIEAKRTAPPPVAIPPQPRRQSAGHASPIRSLVATVDLAEKLSDPALDECQRDGVYAVALRTVADEALADARDVWRQVHQAKQRSGGTLEAAREAQAREQYYRFKAQAQVAASQAAWFGY